jgi:tyrosine-protein phosphatase YwqE
LTLKEKTEELLVKYLKIYEKKMQEVSDSIKRTNLRIMDIEEGEELQETGMSNIVNKIITENFLILEKTVPIQVQEASRIWNRPDQNRTTPGHIIIKTTSTEITERIPKAAKEKKQITYKGKPIKITDFPMETLKARRAWSEVFWELKENDFNPIILYPEKLAFKINGAIKGFHVKEKLK